MIVDGTAVILCDGLYASADGKTAHGLVRETGRYKVVAVIDAPTAGKDAGTVLDGKFRGIPIYESLSGISEKPDYCIVGIATHGGRLTDSLRKQLHEALIAGMHIVNGLHEYAIDDPVLVEAAKTSGVTITDIRRSKPKSDLHFWTGEITKLGIPTIAVLGTDCALGKRTTSRFLLEACNRADISTQLIFTGQTGWLQGAPCGFVLDSIPNDFVSGELEHAILECAEQFSPELILLEGQSSLRNPSGPCGAEFLLSGCARGVILQHAPGRTYFDGFEELGYRIPPIQEEIALVRLYGSEVLGITLNGSGLNEAELIAFQQQYEAELGLPVVLPLKEGVAGLIPAIQQFMQGNRN
ncbi:MAG: DUF1611 domain-containing protein [Anaerolineae bacterium]|nr:DUF1611 domain-containing protein [Gloeobacterales cyanobacterium ES-bin-313]